MSCSDGCTIVKIVTMVEVWEVYIPGFAENILTKKRCKGLMEGGGGKWHGDRGEILLLGLMMMEAVAGVKG